MRATRSGCGTRPPPHRVERREPGDVRQRDAVEVPAGDDLAVGETDGLNVAIGVMPPQLLPEEVVGGDVPAPRSAPAGVDGSVHDLNRPYEVDRVGQPP